MTELTDEQKDKYFEDDAEVCPFCGGSDIYVDDRDYVGKAYFQYIVCPDCEETWREEYMLVDISETG